MKRSLFLALALLLAPVSAWAACASLAASGLSFGTYTGLAVTNSAATITLNGCTTSFAFSVGLNAGTTTGGTVTTRQMASGANRLNYQMFQDASSTTNWGNTLGVDARAGITGAATSVPINVYAKLLSLQYPAPGTYTDTITATGFNSGNIQTTFLVDATVQPTCTISTTDLAFGTYMGLQLDGTSTITATCTNTTPYQIGFNAGLYSSGIFWNWNLRGPTGTLLSYKLYKDVERTNLEGGSVGNDTLVGTGSGIAQVFTVYGRIAAGQYPAPGSYTDTVNLILYY